MYETFFGLKRRPFLSVPDTDFYFSLEIMEEARRMIERTVQRGEGISLIFGPSGTGKTLLLRLLRQTFENGYIVSLIANGHLDTPKSFFQQLLFDLNLPFSGGDEAELRLQLLDFARQETTAGIALLVDESQFLGQSVLEEIRLLTNCDNGAMPFFRAVLAGTVEFEEKLTHPKLEAFNQRVVSRSYLEPFSREETCQYIDWQSNLSKGKTVPPPDPSQESGVSELASDPAYGLAEFIENSGFHQGHRIDFPHVKAVESIFSGAAKRQIHQLTNGVPRLINQLCDTSLQLAAERVLRRVDEILVHSAWARLQQIDESEPISQESPGRDESTMSTESVDEIVARKKATFRLKPFDSIVQFGTLDPEPKEIAKVDEPQVENIISKIESSSEASSEVEMEPENTLFDGVETFDEPLESTSENTIESAVEADDPESRLFAEEVDNELLFASDSRNFSAHEQTESDQNETERSEFVRFQSIYPMHRPMYRQPTAETFSKKYLHRKVRYFATKSESRKDARKSFGFWGVSVTFLRFDNRVPLVGYATLHPLFYSYRLVLSPQETKQGKMMQTSNFEPIVEFPIEKTVDIDRLAVEQTTSLEISFEESPMDAETLERYGAEILEGRPPFIRKEPNYAYRTTDDLPGPDRENHPPEYPYSDPTSGNVIMLRWIQPEIRDDLGFGTAYRDFLLRESKVPNERMENDVPEFETKAETTTETTALNSGSDSAQVVQIFLTEGRKSFGRKDVSTALDERFDEISAVMKDVVVLDELFRSRHPRIGQLSNPATPLAEASRWDDPAFQRQIEAVVARITEAAEKIEQAAEVSEEAGRHVKQAAEFVEMEVQAALPTYVDLFQELSEFQRTISEELNSLQEMNQLSETLKSLQGNDLSAQSQYGYPLGLVSAAKLLPFPRRPNFGPIDPNPESLSGTVDSATSQDSQNSDETVEDSSKDDQSIDVRTLFQ